MSPDRDHSAPSDEPRRERASTEDGLSCDYDLLRRRLERAVATQCPRFLRDRSDDLVQVALLKVMEIDRKSEGNSQFTTSYLWKAASSALIDEIRRQRRRQEVPLEEPDRETDVVRPGVDPEQRTGGRQIGEAIQECLKRLVENRRLAVTLYLQGHSVPESASILGWGVKRTENLVFRGRDDLRKCLSAKGLEP